MAYFFSKTIESDFEPALEQAKLALKSKGFGILTSIDMQKTMQDKLEKTIGKYTILGACIPHFAYEALQKEALIGLMLPCNVIVKESNRHGMIEIAAVDPVVSMQGIDNDELKATAATVKEKLKSVIESL